MTARVLVVDDVLPNVKLLEAKLASEYFDVLCATSGPDALEIVQREQPDIVLLDVMMPGMNGFEVCRHIKSDPKTNHIPVIMVTALDQMSDKVAGLEAGAEDFLTKPVDDIALFARVKSLVRLKVMMDELKNRENTGAVLAGLRPKKSGRRFSHPIHRFFMWMIMKKWLQGWGICCLKWPASPIPPAAKMWLIGRVRKIMIW
ncbi:hypothetical protein JCM17846_31920 [Iodidimonas nitroreducens]|uniref:Response regulatory domain-containing protein n=1 Tax=Iodidimonas nitroreducens TaxID=1236968 RepID=A0A5A7NDC6_9PROT|nr:response regulator [Iodidimonas nitroreducens]GER05510.1 hypothetical protein JCM17846_31920 [Iodidimonas nitroreducens]